MALAAQVGLPLSGMNRYNGFQRFSFGEWIPSRNLEGKEVLRSEMALVVGGEWRIEGREGFVLSSSEHFGDPRTDGHAMPFYRSLGEEGRPVVEGVEVHADGGLTVLLSGGYVLRVLPSAAEADKGVPWHSTEAWRFIPPENDPRGHLVLDARGLSWSR